MDWKRSLLALILLIGRSASGQDLANFERVLLPVDPTVAVHGVNHSLFQATLNVFALNEHRLYPGPNGEIVTIAPGTLSQNGLEPFTLERGSIPANGSGRVLFVDRPSDEVGLTLTLATHEGLVGVPVVRERDFRTGPTVFPIINMDFLYIDLGDGVTRTAIPLRRIRLRVYDPDSRGDGAVRVRVWQRGFTPPQQLSESLLPLAQRNGADDSFPAYGEFNLDICLPFSRHTPCMSFPAMITIEPMTPALRYWAYLSLTDTTTNAVTLVTP